MTRTASDANGPASLRDVQLTVWASATGFKANYTFFESGESVSSPPEIDLGFDRSMLNQLLSETRASLAEAAQNGLWSELADPIGPPQTDGARARFAKLLEAVVSEGWGLYSHLSEANRLAEFLRKVEQLPDGSRISVETYGAVIPWEILYPLPFDKNLPDKPPIEKSRLWGARFEIEQKILCKGETRWGVKDHQSASAYVSLNFNPQIEKELSKPPFPSKYRPLVAHEDFYRLKLGSARGAFQSKGDDIQRAVLNADKATVIYLYCHGRGADDHGGEQLEVDEKVYLAPGTVGYKAEEHPYTSGPILILNSCSSGAYSPLSLTNFYSEFKRKLATGVIGTMMPMPATFAAAFGIRLIDDYVNYEGEQPVHIGGVLKRLRNELLGFDNPLGLLYVLQCPLHATARRA